jgi:hypothetical protein
LTGFFWFSGYVERKFFSQNPIFKSISGCKKITFQPEMILFIQFWLQIFLFTAKNDIFDSFFAENK